MRVRVCLCESAGTSSLVPVAAFWTGSQRTGPLPRNDMLRKSAVGLLNPKSFAPKKFRGENCCVSSRGRGRRLCRRRRRRQMWTCWLCSVQVAKGPLLDSFGARSTVVRSIPLADSHRRGPKSEILSSSSSLRRKGEDYGRAGSRVGSLVFAVTANEQ